MTLISQTVTVFGYFYCHPSAVSHLLLEQITNKMKFVVAYTCCTMNNHTGWNRPFLNSLLPPHLFSLSHTPFLLHLPLSHPLAAVQGRSKFAIVSLNTCLRVLLHSKHAHRSRDGLGGARLDVAYFPERAVTYVQTYIDSVKTDPLAMETCRAKSYKKHFCRKITEGKKHNSFTL